MDDTYDELRRKDEADHIQARVTCAHGEAEYGDKCVVIPGWDEDKAWEHGDYHWFVHIDGAEAIIIECTTHLIQTMNSPWEFEDAELRTS